MIQFLQICRMIAYSVLLYCNLNAMMANAIRCLIIIFIVRFSSVFSCKFYVYGFW
jgi:hypothetical protein